VRLRQVRKISSNRFLSILNRAQTASKNKEQKKHQKVNSSNELLAHII
jgi:hypothetical protein